MDAMFQVCKYCKHAKPTETDLLYCEIWNGRYVSMKVVTEILKTILNKFITPSDINK